ncbi:E-selectin-like isoform X1 [Labeo rohita]|uniref:E-selectin-like isoform X1 n=1 Tax=Labeo rohita TaxID=84645 RepID=A0A498N059_LABRO|nr:E-selectin-like isoform X1 [Labeo rohita]
MIMDASTNAQGINSPYKPGHVLVFRCTDVNLKMYGQRAIECLSNGKWDHPYPRCEDVNLKMYGQRAIECLSNGKWDYPYPKCEEVTCEAEQLSVYILTGHPDIVSSYKPGHILVFRCTDVNLKMHGQQIIECLSNGKWDYPYPKCEEVTCEAEQLINVDILIGHPGTVPPYKPGHILVFRCTDVSLKMHGQQTIECLSNGKWNHPYPKCEVPCNLNTRESNIKMERFPDFECPVKPGYNVTFSCNGQGLILKGQREIACQSNREWSSPFPTCEDVNLKMHGQRTIECLSNGKWNYPYPKCEELTCNLNTRESNIKMERFPDFECPVKPGYNVIFSCNGQGLILKGQKEITCQSNGEWSSPFPTCEEVACEAEQLSVHILLGYPEVACEAEQLNNVDILIGHPGITPPYKPGHILVFRCTDVNLKMHGQRTIECLSNGKWNYPYPKCEDVNLKMYGQ